MSARIEITHLQTGRRQAVEVPATSCWLVPESAGIALVVSAARGAANGLQLVATRTGHRLEPAAGQTQVCVGAEWLYCKDLQAGDTFELAGHRLRWLIGDAVIVAPTARGVRPRAAGEPGRAPRRTRGRAFAPVAVVFAVTLGGALFALRVGARSDWPQSPQQHLDLARTRLDTGHYEQALASIDRALPKADGATAAAARALRREVEQAMLAVGAARTVVAARAELELIQGLRDRWLVKTPARPAAREVVRQTQQWLHVHRAQLAAIAAGQSLLHDAEALVATWSPLAQPSTADTGDDVLFAAQAHLRFQVREYRPAIARVDAFLAAHPGDAVVTAARDALLAAGERWLVDAVAQAVRTCERGDRAQAEAALHALERYAVLSQWSTLVEPLRTRLK